MHTSRAACLPSGPTTGATNRKSSASQSILPWSGGAQAKVRRILACGDTDECRKSAWVPDLLRMRIETRLDHWLILVVSRAG
eukprot:4736748-Pleurochrysis_carterae.AAC.3